MLCVMRLSTFKTSPKEAVQKKKKKKKRKKRKSKKATFRHSIAPEILFRGKEIPLDSLKPYKSEQTSKTPLCFNLPNHPICPSTGHAI